MTALGRVHVDPGDVPDPDVCRHAVTLIEACLAEAGYPQTADRPWQPNGNRVVFPRVPDDVLDRARVLVFDRLGIRYQIDPAGAQ